MPTKHSSSMLTLLGLPLKWPRLKSRQKSKHYVNMMHLLNSSKFRERTKKIGVTLQARVLLWMVMIGTSIYPTRSVSVKMHVMKPWLIGPSMLPVCNTILIMDMVPMDILPIWTSIHPAHLRLPCVASRIRLWMHSPMARRLMFVVMIWPIRHRVIILPMDGVSSPVVKRIRTVLDLRGRRARRNYLVIWCMIFPIIILLLKVIVLVFQVHPCVSLFCVCADT